MILLTSIDDAKNQANETLYVNYSICNWKPALEVTPPEGFVINYDPEYIVTEFDMVLSVTMGGPCEYINACAGEICVAADHMWCVAITIK